MKLVLTSTLIAALIFLIIDIIWLSFSVKSFYGPRIGHLFADKPVIWAAAMFYIISVSYTHQTLPTILRVYSSVVV